MTEASEPDTNRTPFAAACRRSKWLPMLLALLVFTGGLVCGGGLTLLAIRQRLLHGLHHPEHVAERVARRLEFTIGLSAEQTARVEAVLRRRQAVLRALRERLQPEIEDELRQLGREVGEVLEEPQRRRWEGLFDDFCRTWIPPLPPRTGASPSYVPAGGGKESQ